MEYVLHYAPDNASIIVRLALEHLGLPYRAVLVDRATAQQKSDEYLRLNPAGQIPVLITPDGPIFETAAILLWLADRHGGLAPGTQDAERAAFLKWLFYTANTAHTALRMTFYPEKYIAAEAIPALRAGLYNHLTGVFGRLDAEAAKGQSWFGGPAPAALDFYLAALTRWAAIYPANENRRRFSLSDTPALAAICARVQALPATAVLQKEEGLGREPFTNPELPTPPIGSAT